ncbi:MAG: hypothetical protein M1834_008261 [Cirrosporium novae-zelandiae]|nr:MAG: hypothetical protein M1834_008261 [Cirrosporium novae-zelandiae]
MSVSEDLINFDIIETQKENIQALPSGRSAKALASIFSPAPYGKTSLPTPSDTKNLNDAIRQEYEQELLTISESDDPLDVYDRYVRWTLNAYPSAQATPESHLLPLLERATKAFLSSSIYKNDPRYLKLWLHYIRFFSDSPRETYIFLARHNIGESLALFYEEFAAWLEGAGRWNQAEEVYRLGLEREAKPAERLLRKFGDFQNRFEQRPQDGNDPASPALPAVRPALAAKIDPFHTSTPRTPDPQASRLPSTTSKRSGKQKLAIFSDADNGESGSGGGSGILGGAKGWENIGSIQERKKENTVRAKPWAGETLKAGKKNVGVSKMAVFKDETSTMKLQKDSHIITQNPKTGRREMAFVHMEAVYPGYPQDMAQEVSFEELRAKHRGWLNRNWAMERFHQDKHPKQETRTFRESAETLVEPTEEQAHNLDTDDISRGNSGDLLDLSLEENTGDTQTETDNTTPNVSKENGRGVKSGRTKKYKIREVKGETQTIKTNLDSPTGPKLKRKNSTSQEPTMTFHTRAATDEIYDIFNQPLKSQKHDDDDSVYETEYDEDDYTDAGESTGTGRISCPSEVASEIGDDETGIKSAADETSIHSVSEWSDFTKTKHVPKIGDEDEEDGTTGMAANGEQIHRSTTPPSPSQLEHDPIAAKFIPVPPEDYEPPVGPYRDPLYTSQNRLPFMTPIVERTECSTVFNDRESLASKTPSRNTNGNTPSIPEDDGEFPSSPFQEVTSELIPTGEDKSQPLDFSQSKEPKDHESKPKTRGTLPIREIVPKGPIINDTQCNPMDESVRQAIFGSLQPPLSVYEGFFDQRPATYSKGSEIRKYAKALSKLAKSGGEKTATVSIPPTLSFEGTDRKYMIKRELGKGAFAPVYLVENVSPDSCSENDENEVAQMGKGLFSAHTRRDLEAIKMEDPPTPWEFYIMRQAHRRLGVSRPAESIIHAYEFHLFADEGYLVEEYRDQGTLLDLINIARTETSNTSGGGMDEHVAMFFTVELLRTVEALHAKSLIHGDLKADNCLVRFDTLSNDNEWSPHYARDGTGGWSSKGIALIDFGRGIDMKIFQPNVQFIADWKTGPTDCAEMRELRPWTFQVDYHGLAGIIHSMLFGKYIDTVAEKSQGLSLGSGATKHHRIREPLKRYWQQDIWGEIFDLLLNSGRFVDGEEGGKLPVPKGMKRCREMMEEWLEVNAEKKGLRAALKRLEAAVREKRR